MSAVIAFSGGCYSGKTTTIKIVKDALIRCNYNVIILSEILREVTDKPIDELRKSPSEYLNLQYDIITKKILQENRAFNDTSDVVYLADRAITDSLFYLENYVDKSKLPEQDIERLCKLDSAVRAHAVKAFSEGYTSVLEFEPLQIKNKDDKYRPKYLEHLSNYEFDAIHTLNLAYSYDRINRKTFLKMFDMQTTSPEDVAKLVITKILKNY